MPNRAEGYVSAVADALQAAGLRVEGYDTSGTEPMGGSVTIFAGGHSDEPSSYRVLGWSEEYGWFSGRPTNAALDELEAIGYLPLDAVAPTPKGVASVASRTAGGDIAGRAKIPYCWRTRGADDGFDEMLAAYAAKEVPDAR